MQYANAYNPDSNNDNTNQTRPVQLLAHISEAHLQSSKQHVYRGFYKTGILMVVCLCYHEVVTNYLCEKSSQDDNKTK